VNSDSFAAGTTTRNPPLLSPVDALDGPCRPMYTVVTRFSHALPLCDKLLQETNQPRTPKVGPSCTLHLIQSFPLTFIIHFRTLELRIGLGSRARVSIKVGVREP